MAALVEELFEHLELGCDGECHTAAKQRREKVPHVLKPEDQSRWISSKVEFNKARSLKLRECFVFSPATGVGYNSDPGLVERSTQPDVPVSSRVSEQPIPRVNI